jgi:DNA-binding NarL/FixJ family response regulator
MNDLLRDVPDTAAICAPGGFGKSTLLGELAAVTDALLVDDAHHLSDQRLHELIAIAERPDARLIVAYRPWPRPAPLARLTELLRRTRPVVTLPPLTASQIPDVPAGLAGFITAFTGGVPRYVARLVPTLTGPQPPARVPAAALAPFAPELDELDADLRTLLLAVEAGGNFDLIAALLGRDAQAMSELVAAAQATGMLTAAGRLVPLARYAIAALGPIAQRVGVRQRLAELQLARGGPVLPLVRHLLAEPTAGTAATSPARGPLQGAGPSLQGAGPSLQGAGPSLQGAGFGATLGSAGLGATGLGATGLGATGLGATGLGATGLGAAFEAAGEEALRDDPALAARLFAAAADAGRPAAARHALATALTGDLDQAARLADRTVATGAPAQQAEAAYVAAVALAHRGQLDRAADLLRWAGPGPGASFRAVALAAVGQPVDVDEGPDGPPTLLHSTAGLMARGVRESLTDAPASALSTLVQASSLLEPAGAGVLLPDSPAALAALVALHGADLDVAEATLDRAIRTELGGSLLTARHLLLQAWCRMLRGQLATAARLVTDVTAPRNRLAAPTGRDQLPGGRDQLPGGRDHLPGGGDQLPGGRDHLPGGRDQLGGRDRSPALGGRDRLFAAALTVGLARRDSDLVGLRAVWPDACQVLIGQPVDLFMLLPLGELAVAAARLGEHRRVATHLGEAERLLRRLGDPPLWSAPLHWSRLHAAILAEETAEAERHAEALDRLSDAGPYPAALASAAHGWLAVLTERIDASQVELAARGLAALGLAWDGARLAGQAAIRTTDRKAMALLLDCARALQGRPSTAEPGEPVEQLLSEREREVAALVLAGMTYKQVADKLYLSAKTVEHHIARMRQRLGCTDRPELLARLRELLAETPGAVA